MASRLNYPQDHSTHLPILIGLAHCYTTRSVVEFGAGAYSTPLFLNLKVFPKVNMVLSEELDSAWRNKVSELIGHDSRHCFSPESFSNENFRPQFVDLILIDNGPEQHKIETIRDMSARATDGTIFAVHDSEHGPYREEINKFKFVFNFTRYNPETAICTNENFGETWQTNAYAIDRTISEHSHLAPDNIPAWLEAFQCLRSRS